MEERGLFITHATIMCLVHQYEPELDKRIPRHIKDKKDSWEVDKADVKAKGFILRSQFVR